MSIDHFFSLFKYDWIIFITAKILFLGIVYLLVIRYFSKAKNPLIIIIAIFVLRTILFENPIAWYFYNKTLDAGDIGWRQNDVVKKEFAKYKYQNQTKYLAIGSSQTGAIFDSSLKRNPELAVFSLAGLGPLDFFVYRKYILNYKPEIIFLYLSDFDIGRKPLVSGARIGPNQGINLLDIFTLLKHKYPNDEETASSLREWIVGEFFIEYKYSFLFNGLVNKWFGKKLAYPEKNVLKTSDEEQKKNHLNNLLTKINPEEMNISISFLSMFFDSLKDKKIKVIILEGHYHNEAYLKNYKINRQAIHLIKSLTDEYKFVKFLPRSELMSFSNIDYRDGYHVKQKAAQKFVTHLLNKNF